MNEDDILEEALKDPEVVKAGESWGKVERCCMGSHTEQQVFRYDTHRSVLAVRRGHHKDDGNYKRDRRRGRSV